MILYYAMFISTSHMEFYCGDLCAERIYMKLKLYKAQ